jgi:archaeal flagellar protein FlaI
MLSNGSGDMAISRKKLKPGEYEIVQEGDDHIMNINFIGLSYPPSIENNKLCMASIIDRIVESPNISRLVLSADKNYLYDAEQTKMLREIANIYIYLTKQKKIVSLYSTGMDPGYSKSVSNRFGELQYIVTNLIRSDPLGAYVELKRLIREQKIKLNKIENEFEKTQEEVYLKTLQEMFDLIEKTKLISLAKGDLDGFVIGDRTLYSNYFRPLISPNFMHTRMMAEPPLGAEEMDSYSLEDDAQVMIFNLENDIKYRYHLTPPEFNLDEDYLELLDLARTVLAEHEPVAEEFTNPERMRETFFNIGRDLIGELAQRKGIDLDYSIVEKLAKILVRYTVGFGLLEIILADEKIQDVVVNGPIGENPIYIVHQDYGECSTNIIPSKGDGDGWATKFRLISGRPLDEANPVLDTELIIPGARARVAIITAPLNPVGLGYAFRRHRDNPWTLPLFMDKKMINSMGAALLSFLIDGGRTILFAGTRSSGKTSLLGSAMVEIMRKNRIITVEDTMELPVSSLRKLGYNIQPLKVRSALMEGGTELSAEEGIRTSLRLGDSSLIVGEVRSKEALALYEAMRVGALANVVAGTIHGGSPYSIFDRVVNDLGVPRTSFKATDIIVISNPIKSPDGLKKLRRVLSITEVRKEWEDDPLREGGFVDLMLYNPETDELEPTDNLLNGDSEIIKQIAGNVKEWAGNWDAVWENIMLRKTIKEELLSVYHKTKRKSLLEAPFVISANDQFHKISDSVLTKYGEINTKRILFRWKEWLKTEVNNADFK